MTLIQLKEHIYSELSLLYPSTEIQSLLTIILKEYLGLQRIDIVTRPKLVIPSEKITTITDVIHRLKTHEPIQHIIGNTEFFGYPFDVNQHVLIPRPETEELVDWVIRSAREIEGKGITNPLSILDIGTGSGCISISLKKNLVSANVSAIDISKKAIDTAQENAKRNKVAVEFITQDILATTSLPKTYDIIISNPPYVRELEKELMHENVLNFEPQKALFVEDQDPLVFYRKIAQLSKLHLNHNGLLFFEINEFLGNEMIQLLDSYGFSNIQLKKDMFNKNRMISAKK